NEGTSDFTVSLSGPSAGLTVGTSPGTGTITEDADALTVNIGNASAAERSEERRVGKEWGASGGTETVAKGKGDDTAIHGTDYTSAICLFTQKTAYALPK